MKPGKLSPISKSHPATLSQSLRSDKSQDIAAFPFQLNHAEILGFSKKQETAEERLANSFSSSLSISTSRENPQTRKNAMNGSRSLDTRMLSASLKKKKPIIPPISPFTNSKDATPAAKLSKTPSYTNPSLLLDAVTSQDTAKNQSKRNLKATIWTRREILARAAEERLVAAKEQKIV